MFKKNILMAIRHIVRYKEYSLLNLVGLTVGMACALLIILWVDHQVNMDKFHKNGDNIYVLRNQVKTSIWPSFPGPLAPALISEVPEIKDAVRITWQSRRMFTPGEESFYENGFYADSTFFKVFSFDLTDGNPATALNQPNSVVISEKLAKKYFGYTSVTGKTLKIRYDKDELFTITGVFKDVPVTSSLEFDFVLPFSKYYQNNKAFVERWDNRDLRTFVLADPNVNKTTLKDKMTAVLYKHDEWSKTNKVIVFSQPLEEMYLYNDFKGSIEKPSGMIVYIRILILVALLIIILACMNYVNMATALATKRAREVGVKKTFGSGRGSLVKQFIAESITLSLVSFVVSCGLVRLFLPGFNQLLQENITFTISNPVIIAIICLVPFITGLMAGLFPAVYLSSFKPIVALKSIHRPGKGNIQIRHVLVVFQFVITIAFIISSIVVFKQLKYIQNKNLGLNKDNVIFFNQNTQIPKHREAFKEELKKVPGVLSVSYTFKNPLNINSSLFCRGNNSNEEFSAAYMLADNDFTKTLGIEVIMGRNFSIDLPADANSVLINQEMAKTLGFENPVGEIVKFGESNVTVVGVVKDFHFDNLHVPVKQMIMFGGLDGSDLVMVKIKGDGIQETIKAIETKFHGFENNIPFEYSFLDKEYNRQYQAEQSMSKLSNLFTVVAIIISCLGLFGLALFTAEQRTKEIGVRKASGANTGQVLLLLIKDFTKWIVISFIIASAIAFYVLNTWLQSFAYRTNLSWWIFLLTGLLTATIALITVSWQSWRAANRNPVEALRYE